MRRRFVVATGSPAARSSIQGWEQDLITNSKGYLNAQPNGRKAIASRFRSSPLQPPKGLSIERSSRVESNATSNMTNDGRNQWEISGETHGEQY
ncbi:xaa-Pro dipeptidase [Dorcoceras hygrometricum]|uniref:Xaa-Pro dipeptidase n=1 Tax=Dorcoceras hygrometricum TaxID=472368 RepID=A0A2Z7B2G4_9LAMI|nr:xaa-Pro dipeptidase [Dorcoceras hygrometricum]